MSDECERVGTPSAAGIEKYPPDGFYEGDACTCQYQCLKTGCKGGCGCRACYMGWVDFGYDEEG